LQLPDRCLDLDDDGFLRHIDDWDEHVAAALAAQDEVDLSDEHWAIIYYVREYYAQHGSIPIMRVLAKAIARDLGEERGRSRYLYRLFKQGPVRQASRYGGLPKPPSCI
jgi:tRNA 2-thiouridine synthesizing protein E